MNERTFGGPEAEHAGADGSQRKNYYGAGKQPWDMIKDQGWGIHFAAGNVLKYLKRRKHKGSEQSDIEKAQWYWRELMAMPAAALVRASVIGYLDAEERELLAASKFHNPRE